MAYFGDMDISSIKLNKQHHKLLGLICHRVIEYESTRKGIVAVNFETIYSALNCDRKQLNLISAKLFTEKECDLYSVSGIEGLYCTPAGITAYVTKKYLKENRQLIITSVKDGLGITIAIIAICSAIFTALKSISLEQRNKQDIKTLQKEVDSLKQLRKYPVQE